MPNLISAHKICGFKAASLKKACIFLFLLFIFCGNVFGQGVTISSPQQPGPTEISPIELEIYFSGTVNNLDISDFKTSNGILQNLSREEPDFEFQDSENLDQFTINRQFGISDFSNLDKIIAEELGGAVISIDFNANNELFYLTLKNGLFKLGQSSPVIAGDSFETPLDMIIDRNRNRFLIADSEQGKIFIYDSNYDLINTIGTGNNGDSENPRGATGLALDPDGNIYVADNFTGNTENQDAIKIYSPDGTYLDRIRTFNGQQIEDPFRIEVDQNYNIYLSESGGEDRDPRVIIFDKDYDPVTSIDDVMQGTPGSLVVDDFGYLYVVDYKNDFNLTNLVNDPLAVLLNYETIRDSQYSINVFNTSDNFSFVKEIDNNLNLPIDLVLDECEKLIVNNLELSGPGPSNYFFGYPTRIEANFDFTLKIFQRKDFFTAEIVPENEGLVEVLLEDVDLFPCDPQPEGEFSIEYKLDEEEDTPPEFTNCPISGIQKNNDPGECGAVVSFDIPTVSDDSGNITPTRTDNSGLNSGDVFPVGETTITFEADDGVNTPVECSFTITVIDNEEPVFVKCPEEIIEIYVEEGETGINYQSPVIGARDNCGTLNITQTLGPEPGEFMPLGITSFEYIAIDKSGLRATCSFQIDVIEKSTDTPPEFTSCPSDIQKNNDTGICGAVVTFDVPTVSDDGGNITPTRTDTSGLNSGDVFPVGETTITFEADDGVNEAAECSFTITVIDNEDPVFVECPEETIEIFVDEGETGTVFESPKIEAKDNCGAVVVIQTAGPQGGETIPLGITNFEFTARDQSANKATCSFKVNVQVKETGEPSFDCPSAGDFEPIALNQDCDYEVPNYRDSIDNFENIENPRVEEFYTKNDASVTVTLEVYDGNDFVGDCVFDVPVEDTTPPNILNCSDLGEEVMINVGNTYHLDDYRDLLEVEDCSGYEISQLPEPGFSISQTNDVSLTVTDDNGNSSTCTFTVEVTVVEENVLKVNCPGNYNIFADENCNYYVPNFSDIVETTIEGAEITQSQQAGSIFDNNNDPYIRVTATYEDQTYFCDIYLMPQDDTNPVIQCPADEMIAADTYTIPNYTESVAAADNCGDVEITQDPVAGTEISKDATVTITATDIAGNTAKCEVNINLVAEGEIAITCPEDKVEAFNEDCLFVLPDYTSEAKLMNGEGLTVIQDPLAGTEISTSEVEVTLSIQDEEENQCSFTVFLEDRTAPVLQLKDIQIDLTEEGTASINFEDIDNGSYDNCDPDFSYRLNKSVFSCKDLGMNTIEVTAEDSNGNISSARVTITVLDPTGFCGEGEGSEYIFIYPNPNTGSFKVATPSGEKILRMEVFDHRGRFITARDYNETVSEYAMELGPLQEAVYVVKIETNERTLVKRMIFKY